MRPFIGPIKQYSKAELRRAVSSAVEARDELRDLDAQISNQIRRIENLLYENNVDAFDSGEYSYACRNGQWRFIKTLDADRRPVLDLPRNERAEFLRNLKLPNPLHEYDEP